MHILASATNTGLQAGGVVGATAALITALYAVFHGQRQDHEARVDSETRQKADLTSIAVQGQAALIGDLQEEVARLRKEISVCEEDRASDRVRLERMEKDRSEDLAALREAQTTMESYKAEVQMLRRRLGG